MYYVCRIRPIGGDVIRNVVSYLHVWYFYVPLLFDSCDMCYLYQGWAGWIDYTSFERHFSHPNNLEESVFTGRHNKEILAVPIEKHP